MENELVVSLVALVLLFGLFATGIELAFAMAITGIAGYSYLYGFGTAVDMFANDVFETFSSYGLTVMPLFILMGQFAYNAGIAKRLLYGNGLPVELQAFQFPLSEFGEYLQFACDPAQLRPGICP